MVRWQLQDLLPCVENLQTNKHLNQTILNCGQERGGLWGFVSSLDFVSWGQGGLVSDFENHWYRLHTQSQHKQSRRKYWESMFPLLHVPSITPSNPPKQTQRSRQKIHKCIQSQTDSCIQFQGQAQTLKSFIPWTQNTNLYAQTSSLDTHRSVCPSIQQRREAIVCFLLTESHTHCLAITYHSFSP